MSSAFVREGDDQWLHEIAPSIEALINYLSRENGGLPISVKKIELNAEHVIAMLLGRRICLWQIRWPSEFMMVRFGS